MTWRYQATHRTVKGADWTVCDVFEVREVYTLPGADSDKTYTVWRTWTESAIVPDSDTKEGLIEVLQMMLKDVQEFDVLEVDE